jgi:hypothetical protein
MPDEVALDVGAEHRHAGAGKPLGQICSVTVLPVPVAPVIKPVPVGDISAAGSSGRW